MSSTLRCFGIFANVDAGKTTLTERILYECGAIPKPGSVDKGTTASDTMTAERQRGISVRSSYLACSYNNCGLRIGDTPGHVDFGAEAQRCAAEVDAAVLLLSAADGVLPRTELLWSYLRTLGKPTIIFINKCDMPDTAPERAVGEVRSLLSDAAVALPVDFFEAAPGEAFAEELCLTDEALMERWLEGGLSAEELRRATASAVRNGRLFPIICGSARTGEGVGLLLKAITELFPAPRGSSEGELSATVVRVTHDPRLGRLCRLRLWNGTLHPKDVLHTPAGAVKVTRLFGGEGTLRDVTELRCGETGAVMGLPEAHIGDVFGVESFAPRSLPLVQPVMDVLVTADCDRERLREALLELSDEDPALNFRYRIAEKECVISSLGPLQLEILGGTLRERFGIGAEFGKPTVLYRETPAKPGRGFESYTMPKPCWAIVELRIEPGAPGSGLAFSSTVNPNQILPVYQNHIARSVRESLVQGIKGWEVVDLAVTLVGGEHHKFHTHPMDFFLATPMAFMNGLVDCGTKVLEPMYAFELSVPEEYSGRILTDMVQLRAEYGSPVISGGRFRLRGRYPAAEGMDYETVLASRTSGRGSVSMTFGGYSECPLEPAPSVPYRGVSPLDRAAWILAKRGAI